MAGLDSTGAMQEFVDAFDLPFPNAVDEDGSLWAHFGVPYQPAGVFVDDSGLHEVIQGAMSEEDLARTLEELMAN
jgi:hypothetical protein